MLERCLVVEDITIAIDSTIFDTKVDLQPTAEETLGALLLDDQLLLNVLMLDKLLLVVAQLTTTRY